MKNKKRILFVNLTAFLGTGGIEKVCRAIYKALEEESVTNSNFDYRIVSAHDSDNNFNGGYAKISKIYNANKSKLLTFLASIWHSLFSETILFSHINLAPIAVTIKIIYPKKKIIIIAHGIEIWGDLNYIKKKALKISDRIIAVSNFTKESIVKSHNLDKEKIIVINNCLDPFIKKPKSFQKSTDLMLKYNISSNDIVLFTLTRLSSLEKYKGYDKVIEVLASIVPKHPKFKYFIGGKGDLKEILRVKSLITKYKLQENVQLLGFINDDELESHFLMADTYIMPSQGEGFGIVFIEAAYYGLPIIAGSKDGSVDALMSGQLGSLIDPDNLDEIKNAIINSNLRQSKSEVSKLVEENFGFPIFKSNIINTIS